MNISIPEAFGELLTPSRYKAYYGGRAAAKSHSFAKALLLRGGMKQERILCARETQKSIKDSVKLLLDTQIEELGLTGFYRSIQTEIRGANGTRFIFSGLGEHTVDTIKSYEGITLCWLEEAHVISKTSLEILIPTIRAPGSEIWASWNPRHASDPVDQRFRGLHPPEDAIIRSVNYWDNPFFSEEMEQERQYDRINNPDRYSFVWEGAYEPQALGAIWTRQDIHDGRIREAPDTLERIVVSVDHAVGEDADAGNEHGIIVAGLDDAKKGYVLEDLTTRGKPEKWASRAVAAYDKWEADAIVYETNQGGALVRSTLEAVRPGIPLVPVTASRGKHVRAEPIAALYGLGRVHHAGSFPELEAQMCLMTAAGYEGEGSPDRVDAMVWAFTELFPKMTQRPTRKKRTNRRHAGWMG